jgi:hypothetical protein
MKRDGEDLVAALAANGHLPDRDFIFTWNEKPPVAPVIRAWLDENRRGLLEIRLPVTGVSATQSASVSVTPTAPPKDRYTETPSPSSSSPSETSHSSQVTRHNTSAPPDVYCLLDRSGSMQGANWAGACKALAAFVPRLHPDTRLWLSLFESTVRDYDAVPVRAGDIDFGPDGKRIHHHGTAGGTELVPALRHLGDKMREHSAGRSTAVLLITDGEVGNEHGAVSAAQQLGCPVHLLGVAMTANDGLDAIARSTGGRSVFLAPGEDIPAAVERFAPILRAPVITGLSLTPGWQTADESPLRNLCDGDDIVIPISATPEAAELTLTFAHSSVSPVSNLQSDIPSPSLLAANCPPPTDDSSSPPPVASPLATPSGGSPATAVSPQVSGSVSPTDTCPLSPASSSSSSDTRHLSLVTCHYKGASLCWSRSRIRHLDASKRKDEALALAKEFNLLSRGAAFIAWDDAEKVPVAQTEIVQPALHVSERSVRLYSAIGAAPLCVDEDEGGYNAAPSPRRVMRPRGKSAPPSPRRKKVDCRIGPIGTLLMLPVAVVYALIEYLSPDNDAPALRPELTELIDRLRQLVDRLYPGRSYPHEVRDALQQIKTILAKLGKVSEAERTALQTEAVDQLQRLLQSLREHSRHRQQELQAQAQGFAELEHTTARLAEALQHEIVRAEIEAAGATA